MIVLNNPKFRGYLYFFCLLEIYATRSWYLRDTQKWKRSSRVDYVNLDKEYITSLEKIFLYEAPGRFQAGRKWRRLEKPVHRGRVIARMG